MPESVCATALAVVAAIGLSIVLVRNLPLERLLGNGIPLADNPGFPAAAAVEGLVAATAVGALAGLLPAIIPFHAIPSRERGRRWNGVRSGRNLTSRTRPERTPTG